MDSSHWGVNTQTQQSNMAFIKIISGGQTGVDRAALDAALELGIPCGGKCPRGRLAEDGTIPDRYPLTEIASDDYSVRTKANVLDADGTLILNYGHALTGGTAFTAEIASETGKPLLVVDIDNPTNAKDVVEWLRSNEIQALNVAGPRETGAPGIQAAVTTLLRDYFRAIKATD